LSENHPLNATKSLLDWEQIFERKIKEVTALDAAHSVQDGSPVSAGNDPAHDHAHFLRVVTSSKHLALSEGAKLEVVIPAAWLHDIVNVPKNDPRRSMASRLSGEEALRFLSEVGYPEVYFEDVRHAIEAHSFSARIEAKTLEAQVVQDADRLDGLGAIGLARVFSVGGMLQRRIYEPLDPFATGGRELNDLENTIDHFFVKLFKTAETLQTRAGREEGKRRVEFMRLYLQELGRELGKAYKLDPERAPES
jgi:uncharacterized protein